MQLHSEVLGVRISTWELYGVQLNPSQLTLKISIVVSENKICRTLWSSKTWPGLGKGSTRGCLLSPAPPPPSFSHKPFPGVHWRFRSPSLEGLPDRGADVPGRLPANAVRAAAHVQAQGAADKAADSHHRPGVQKGEPWGEARTWLFPFSASCPDLRANAPAWEAGRVPSLSCWYHRCLKTYSFLCE